MENLDEKLLKFAQGVTISANSLGKKVKQCERVNDPNFLIALAKNARRLSVQAQRLAKLARKNAKRC